MKTAVFQLRLSPEKKAEWKARAEKANMRLGPWIESMCDRPDDPRKRGPVHVLSEPASAKDIKKALGITREDEDAAHEAVTVASGGGVYYPEEDEVEIEEVIGFRKRHAPNCTCASCRGK